MKDPEINIPSSTETQPFDTDERLTEERRGRLRKIGGKILSVTGFAVTSAWGIHGIAHSVDPSLPPQYSIPASIAAGAVLGISGERFSAWKEKQRAAKREAAKNPPENPDTLESDSSVV